MNTNLVMPASRVTGYVDEKPGCLRAMLRFLARALSCFLLRPQLCLETFISYLYHVSCSQSTNEVFSAEFFNNLKFGRSIAVPTSLPLGRSMTYSSAFLLLLLNTDIHHIVSGHVIAAPQTLSRRIPSPYPSHSIAI